MDLREEREDEGIPLLSSAELLPPGCRGSEDAADLCVGKDGNRRCAMPWGE